ncbi:uncharacterized protein LOC128227730 isoform X2 [Mya arenaria]|nr:uncharacterized protein LOC128227730 isoform X2 [Mya arenaria]XP_052794490.1 uncharacterized protein LOC128227730 isoform X2 [Mya arenaria]
MSSMKIPPKVILGLGACVVCVVLLARTLSWPNKEAVVQHDKSDYVVKHADIRDNSAPIIDSSALKFSNVSEMFKAAVNEKYGPVRYSHFALRDTTFTKVEKERYDRCVKNGPSDRAKNGSKFWGKAEHIRRTHHSYLGKEGAVLMEVGGNQGNDATEFARLYNPRYIILEPLEEYANILRNKFANNSRVTVVNLGLGVKNEVVFVNIDGNNACATSKFAGQGGKTPLYITNATEFMMKIGVGVFDIDLLTMNCEGCEFEALETLLETNLVSHLKNIQWATHSTIGGIKEPIERYCRIQELLSRTHRPTYQYRFIWESWRRRDLQ